MTDEAAVIRQAKTGSAESFTILVTMYQARVRGYLARWVREPSQVDDLAQEVFIAAFKGLSAFAGDAPFGAWLAGIARNQALTHVRSERRRHQRQGDLVAEAVEVWRVRSLESDSERLAERLAEITALRGCLDGLTETQRNLIDQHYLAGKRACADEHGVRLTPQPIFAWSASDRQSTGSVVGPLVGKRGIAPDGRACLVAMKDEQHVIAVHFVNSPQGLFVYDPAAEVSCDMWVNDATRWAGFYVQDDGSTQSVASGQRGPARMAQWHVPLTVRNGWMRVRFPLRDVVGNAVHPVLRLGDAVHHFMVQAQTPENAQVFIDRLEVVPAD